MSSSATASVTPIRPNAPDAAGAQRRHNEGHGRRLTAAFEALEAFPVLAESRVARPPQRGAAGHILPSFPRRRESKS